MKKKLIIILIVLILIVPIPGGIYRDGGTREYKALIYRVVKWNRLYANGSVYHKASVYWFPKNFRSLDELWKTERPREIAGSVEIENTGLEYLITEKVDAGDFDGCDEISGWFGAREFLGKGYKAKTDENGMTHRPDVFVSYIITMYPDYSYGAQCVTGMCITDPKVTVFGLNCSSGIAEFDSKLESEGFTIEHTASSSTHQARKDDVLIFYGDGEITIKAEVSNVNGIVF